MSKSDLIAAILRMLNQADTRALSAVYHLLLHMV